MVHRHSGAVHVLQSVDYQSRFAQGVQRTVAFANQSLQHFFENENWIFTVITCHFYGDVCCVCGKSVSGGFVVRGYVNRKRE